MTRLRAQVLLIAFGLQLSGAGLCTELAERAQVRSEVIGLVSAGDFAKLEALAELYRSTKARTSSGVWKLTLFNAGVSDAFHNSNKEPEFWAAAEKRVSAWVKRYPKSPTARLAYAQVLLNRGWSIRGVGYANTVEPQNWRPFFEYTAKARRYLETHKAIAASDPRWFETMAVIAYSEGWPEAEFAKLIREAASREPGFYQTYFAAIIYYLPKWGGNASAIEGFAKEVLEWTQAAEGFGMYARIYWYASQEQFGERLFTESLVDWPLMKKGMDDVLKKYPDNWNINNFAKFSCLAQDKTKAAELFARIRYPVPMEAWGPAETFRRCKLWALTPAAAPAK